MKVGPAQVIRIPDYVEEHTRTKWLEKVWANQEEWENRFEFINSYGSAWYLDIETGLLNYYHANAEQTNKLLAGLDGLVDKLTACTKYLQAPDGSTGLPARARRENLGPYWVDAGLVVMMKGTEGQIHGDYEGLAPYPAKLFDPQTRAYSAVISLFKPPVGGNLKIWTKHYLGQELPELEDYFSQVIDYTPGSLILFDSFCYHQILGSELTEAKPYRAIAAMHFLYKEEPHPHWEYWF